MNKYKILFFALAIHSHVVSMAQVRAVTENGEKVFLYENGTWAPEVTSIYIPESIVLDKPDFKGSIAKSSKEIKSHKLTLKSSKANNITDDDAWFNNNGLELPVYEVPNAFRNIPGEIPAYMPKIIDNKILVKAIANNEHDLLIYGEDFSEGNVLIIYNRNIDSIEYVLDFKNYVLSPTYVEEDLMFIHQRIQWATIKDGILYVSTAHNTYSKSSNGMNAYITALDLKTKKVIWRTKPLTCNTSNFMMLDDVIVCGYGFTAEPDFLFTINRLTGSIIQKLPLKSGPSFILKKENELYIRTYNMDYVFKID